VWPNRQFDPHIIVGHLDASFATSVTDGTVAAPGQLLLTLDATALRAQLAHARKELLAAQERTRIAIAGGDAEDLARLEADLRRTDAELPSWGVIATRCGYPKATSSRFLEGWNRETV